MYVIFFHLETVSYDPDLDWKGETWRKRPLRPIGTGE